MEKKEYIEKLKATCSAFPKGCKVISDMEGSKPFLQACLEKDIEKMDVESSVLGITRNDVIKTLICEEQFTREDWFGYHMGLCAPIFLIDVIYKYPVLEWFIEKFSLSREDFSAVAWRIFKKRLDQCEEIECIKSAAEMLGIKKDALTVRSDFIINILCRGEIELAQWCLRYFGISSSEMNELYRKTFKIEFEIRQNLDIDGIVSTIEQLAGKVDVKKDSYGRLSGF